MGFIRRCSKCPRITSGIVRSLSSLSEGQLYNSSHRITRSCESLEEGIGDSIHSYCST